ncbi:integral membrane protein [Apodospora peruviana]|uniref:Integral membrane protein n=1 Tax=Apodospora peruviana TaxID=516989 RepID=A0AAE0M0F1_9PEZI|nr:integral membrane protein [Apodospora peruviana]
MSTSAPLPPYVDHGAGLVAVAWVEASLGLLVLGARLYTRTRIVRKVGWDDWTMIFATILAIVVSAVVTMEVRYGVGKHAAHIPPPDLIKAVEWIWISAPFSTMSACFGKISIALLILRMINRNKTYTIFLWTLIVLLFIINLLLTIITFAQCTPVTWLWDQLNPAAGYVGSCWDPNIQKNYGYFQGAFSAVSDLVLALFPILIIKDLKIEARLKLALCVVMGLGIIATVAAAVKTVQLKNLSTPDFTYNAIDLVYWYMTENWIIVIAACIPTLGPLYFILTGQRTAESFAASPSGRRSGGSSAKRLLGGWKLRSPIVRSHSTDVSHGSDGSSKFSRMEKGLNTGSTDSQTSTSWQSTSILRTTEVTVNGQDLPIHHP